MTARGKRNMEGKNVYLSVFPEFLKLLSFCLLKLTKIIDLQVMRVTIMLRITRLTLSTGWCKKIRITLSTVASSLRWFYTQKVNFFRKELCGRLLPSFYRDLRPDFKLSLFRSHDIIVND